MDKSKMDSNHVKPPISLRKSGSVKVASIANFLSQEERDTLYSAVCIEQEAFHAPKLPGMNDTLTKYLEIDSIIGANKKAELVQQAANTLTKRIIEQLPDLCETLDIHPFQASNIPLTFISGLHGHSGDPHQDTIDSRNQISILYYFHKEPKMFQGGDLNIYAPDAQAQNGYCEKALFQIEQDDNVLVAFPSQTFHGVSEVQCNSTDFADGRFVAVAFLSA